MLFLNDHRTAEDNVMIFDRVYKVEIPAVPIPEARVFAYGTRMSDFDTPSIEIIVKPESEMPCHTVQIHLTATDTLTAVEHWPTPASPSQRLKYEIKRYLHSREPIVELGDRIAIDLRFSHTGNYAHLIHDVLGPMRMVEKTIKHDSALPSSPIHLILPRKASPIALKVLEYAGIPVICTNAVVRGRLISVSQELNVALLPYLIHQPFEPWPTPTPERVFVSRRGLRCLINEDEVTSFLIKEGFQRVYMEDFPVGQQWSMLGNAREIVGIHGAGLSSLGFSVQRPKEEGPRFSLIEMFSAGFSTTCFREYAAVLGGTWVGVRGKITPEIVRDLDFLGHTRAHDQASFEVDIKSLSDALSYSRSMSSSD